MPRPKTSTNTAIHNNVWVTVMIAVLLSIDDTEGFCFHPQRPSSKCQTATAETPMSLSAHPTRQEFLMELAATLGTTTMLAHPSMAQAAASHSPADVNVFANGGKTLSAADAKQRFQAARMDLASLLENYGEISKGGGDAVRNRLGTQGVNSNLFGIQKVLKFLKEESEDIVEYTEAMDEFNAYLYQAEGAAYQSMFAGHSSAKSTPESLLATAKQDIVQMGKYMDQLAAQLSL